MSKFRIAVFAHKFTGMNIVKYLVNNFRQDVIRVYVTELDSDITKFLQSENFGVNNIVDVNELSTDLGKENLRKLNLDTIILAGWQQILKRDIIDIPRLGIINLHPALLPHNAGMHSNFWTLVEDRPYGATIQFIDEGIDSGDIIFQKEIRKTWEDTGKTLYYSAIDALAELFAESYPAIREGKYSRKVNNRAEGSFHYGKELFQKIKLNLDDNYTVRELLNLLRAQNFSPYEGCTFEDAGCKYEVQVNIRKLNDENNTRV